MSNTNIITCAGYYGTGSSAITDLLGEFNEIHYIGDYEYRFIQDPDGISDLEYNIVENYHRHNSGYALKRFKKSVDILVRNKFNRAYENTFKNHFRELMYQYIDDLTAFKFKGYWHRDVIDRGYVFWFVERALDKILNKIIVPLIRGRKNIEPISIHLLRHEKTYVPYPDKALFYEATRRCLDRLFEYATPPGFRFIMVDQLVPPSNTKRYLNYFNNLKIVSVDRDPRDLYCLERYVYKGGIIPIDSVDEFCRWFEITRDHLKTEQDDASKVLRIKFEDLVYRYDTSVNQICNFIGISQDSHTGMRTKFIPELSRHNTQIWEKHPDCQTEIKVIEKRLAQFCYNFPI